MCKEEWMNEVKFQWMSPGGFYIAEWGEGEGDLIKEVEATALAPMVWDLLLYLTICWNGFIPYHFTP